MKKLSFARTACAALLLWAAAGEADILGGLFGEAIEETKVVWELQEQKIRLVKAGEGIANDHPVQIDPAELAAALASLEFWEGGGVFRKEERTRLFDDTQANLLGNYAAQALAEASPSEDVSFILRGYKDVLLDVAKERYWHSGRLFYKDGRLNLIIGEYGKQVDKGQRNAEASFGITEGDMRDVYFNPGSRTRSGNMAGRIVAANGVSIAEAGGRARNDWVTIDTRAAARAYAESQVDPEARQAEQRMKAEAAKRTLETREMKTELARLRAELKKLKQSQGGSSVEDIETRLETLETLREKSLITDAEYANRRAKILEGI